MGLFITSRATNNRHGIFAEQRKSNPIIVALRTGVACLIGQFPWGPDGVVQSFADPASRNNTIAPLGMDRTGSGYLSIIRKAWPDLRIVRILGSAAAKATANLPNAVPTTIAVATLKYKGTAGNLVTWTIANATDGDSNHFNLTIAVSNSAGTTTELLQNVNFSGTGADFVPDLTNSILIGTLVKSISGRPVNGSGTFSGGTNGTINGTRYVGTAGTGDYGIAACENDKAIGCVFSDDPGNTDRATVNAGLIAHATLMGDRDAIINGNSGQTNTQVATDVATYRSNRAIYVDGWYNMKDDTDGTIRLCPPSALMASVYSNVSPSTSPSWKDPEVQALLEGIVSLETPRGAIAGNQTDNGICTLIQEEEGGFTFEAGVRTIAPVDANQKRITRGRMGDFVAKSVVKSLRPSNDAPSVPVTRQRMLQAVQSFMDRLKLAQNLDPEHQPHVLDWNWGSLADFNPQGDLDNGIFTMPLNFKTSAGLEQVYLSMQFGETVQILAA